MKPFSWHEYFFSTGKFSSSCRQLDNDWWQSWTPFVSVVYLLWACAWQHNKNTIQHLFWISVQSITQMLAVEGKYESGPDFQLVWLFCLHTVVTLERHDSSNHVHIQKHLSELCAWDQPSSPVRLRGSCQRRFPACGRFIILTRQCCVML